MCVKGLPPVLMIHLKRFGFDWEAGRAIKSDDYFEVCLVTILAIDYTMLYLITLYLVSYLHDAVLYIVSLGVGHRAIHCSWYQSQR